MIHVFKQTQFLPITKQIAWAFFNNPVNLNEITPSDMEFKILTALPNKVYVGLMIVYNINVFKGVSFEWVTEITHLQEFQFFVDEQRFGPYSLWHHEHHFKDVVGGVEMTDIVHYKLPLGFVGNLFHSILIKPKLDKIFNYRKKVLISKFGILDKLN